MCWVLRSRAGSGKQANGNFAFVACFLARFDLILLVEANQIPFAKPLVGLAGSLSHSSTCRFFTL